MTVKRLTILMTAVLALMGWLPATGRAEASAVFLNAIPDQYRGSTVTITGTTTLQELNMKVVNSEGTIIYVNTFQSQSDGTYSHQFSLSRTEVLGKATVVIGEGGIVTSRSFNIIVASTPETPGTPTPGTPTPGTPTPGTPTPTPTPTPVPTSTPQSSEEAVIVLVNGKEENAGKATTTTVNQRTFTTITLDPKRVEEKLASEGQNAVFTIPVNSASDIVAGELDGQMVKNMELKQAIVEIKTPQAAYTLPAGQINITSISEQLGKNIKLEDIKVRIEMAKPTADTLKVVQAAATQGEFTLVVPSLEFTVKAVYNGQTVEVGQFNAYVQRTIAIPNGVDPSKITTAVVVERDGSVRHVPTKIVIVDGSYFAEVNSLTNSTYSVVWHPVTFKDVEKHWAKGAVNDMGSRMVINGISDELFAPDKPITRAEFAAMIVRGLGLKINGNVARFSDVAATKWYSGYVNTAFESGIVNGFENKTFAPEDKITREQAVAMIARAMEITGLGDRLQTPNQERLNAFDDNGLTSNWAREAFAAALEAGIVSGRTDKLLAPKESVSRAEVATLVQRLLQKSGLI